MKKILLMDLDDTIIRTKSGKMFPQGCWDMELIEETLVAIKNYKPDVVVICSNQGGIEKGFVREDGFKFKSQYICECIKEFASVETVAHSYCKSNDPNDNFRKPNTGMFEAAMGLTQETDKSCYMMVGDASGKEGDFSDSDKMFAKNAGIMYMDVKQFQYQFGDHSNAGI